MSRTLERLAQAKSLSSAGTTIATVPAGRKWELREARLTNDLGAGSARVIFYAVLGIGNVYYYQALLAGNNTIVLPMNQVLYAGEGIGVGIQTPSTLDVVITGIVVGP